MRPRRRWARSETPRGFGFRPGAECHTIKTVKIIVTGTSSGIGRALAERLLAHEHQVWGLARSDQGDFVAAHGGRFRASRADVANWPRLQAVADEVRGAWTTADAIITCAGLQGAVGPALTADAHAWSETVRANLDGTYFALRAFFPLVHRPAGRAKLICFSGGGATKARENFSAYAVAKTGIVRLVENIAAEMKSTRLDINAVAPGAINTRLTDEVIALGPEAVGRAEYEAAKKQKVTGGSSMDRALDLVEWLLSPASDGISGRLLSAPWDPWPDTLQKHAAELAGHDIYQLRRITPQDRGLDWK